MKISWYKNVKGMLRLIHDKSFDALQLSCKGEKAAVKTAKKYIQDDYEKLQVVWTEELSRGELSDLSRHIHFSEPNDYENIIKRDIPYLDSLAEKHALGDEQESGFEELLHPVIIRSSLQQYKDGYYRDAVLNSIIAVYDFIRSKTSTEGDGAQLIGKVFSLESPRLILSEIESESGRNDQKGFIQIFQGAFQGIRNPKAHSLTHDLTDIKAAQYLVFASLLARRIDEAILVDQS